MPDHLERKSFQNGAIIKGTYEIEFLLILYPISAANASVLWEISAADFVKLNIVLDPAILLLGMSLKETSAHVHQEPCTEMFIATLSYTGKNLETIKLKGGWINCVLVVCLYNNIKRSKQMSSTWTQVY